MNHEKVERGMAGRHLAGIGCCRWLLVRSPAHERSTKYRPGAEPQFTG